jgi:hypothetical protein
VEHLFEGLEQLHQRLDQILRVQFAKRGPCIVHQTFYVYSLQYVGNTLHDMHEEALI